MNTRGIVLLDRDLDLLCGPVGGSKQWINDTVSILRADKFTNFRSWLLHKLNNGECGLISMQDLWHLYGLCVISSRLKWVLKYSITWVLVCCTQVVIIIEELDQTLSSPQENVVSAPH